MNRVRLFLTMLLVAWWLPASSHALLQYVGLIHERHADHDADSTGSHEHDADNHDVADGTCALSAPHVNVPTPHVVATPVLLGLFRHGQGWLLHTAPQRSGLAPPGTAPPQLSHSWQFSFRTALPPRAPSFVS